MKNIVAAIVISALTGLNACDEGSNYSFSNNDGKTVVNTSDETGRLRLETVGRLTFTDDETAIKTISADGYVKFKKNGNTLFAEANSSGTVMYTVNNGTPSSTLDEAGKKILVRAIKEMLNVGFDAKNRASRIYAKSGVDGVIVAIEDLRSDYVKSMYFEYLVTGSALKPAEMAIVARKIGEDLGSDYEKSKVLQKISKPYLDDETTTTAYLDAVNTINSDYEKQNALNAIVDQPLTPNQYSQVLSITGNINSDYERANVLKKLISHGTPGENNTNAFLQVTGTISSDYEKANVLKAMVVEGVPAGTSFTNFLNAAGSITSDNERSGVLKELAAKNIPDEEQWIGLIRETEKINSDYEKSNTMIEIAKHMPKNDKIKNAYMLSAKAITSDYDYGQAIKAVN